MTKFYFVKVLRYTIYNIFGIVELFGQRKFWCVVVVVVWKAYIPGQSQTGLGPKVYPFTQWCTEDF